MLHDTRMVNNHDIASQVLMEPNTLNAQRTVLQQYLHDPRLSLRMQSKSI